jgi:hypothetical protein
MFHQNYSTINIDIKHREGKYGCVVKLYESQLIDLNGKNIINELFNDYDDNDYDFINSVFKCLTSKTLFDDKRQLVDYDKENKQRVNPSLYFPHRNEIENGSILNYQDGSILNYHQDILSTLINPTECHYTLFIHFVIKYLKYKQVRLINRNTRNFKQDLNSLIKDLFIAFKIHTQIDDVYKYTLTYLNQIFINFDKMNDYDKIVLVNLSEDIDVHAINMKCWTKSYMESYIDQNIHSIYEPRFVKIEKEIVDIKNILLQILDRLDNLESKLN